MLESFPWKDLARLENAVEHEQWRRTHPQFKKTTMKRKASRQLVKKDSGSVKKTGSLKANQLQILRAPPDEVKVYDANVVDIANATGVVINPLVTQAFTQGTAQRNEFIGRFLTPIGFDIRYHVIGPNQTTGAAVTDLFDLVRIVVFQFLDSDVPTVAGTLQTATVLSPLNLTNYNNINVLMDKLFPIHMTAIDTDVNATCFLNFSDRVYIKGRKMVPIEMNTTGATPTFQKGGIYWCQLGSSTVAPHAAANLHIRLSFKDS